VRGSAVAQQINRPLDEQNRASDPGPLGLVVPDGNGPPA